MKRILLTGALFTAGLGVYGEANAYCTLGNKKGGSFSSVDISMAVGRVVVRPSDPVGMVLRKATFPISDNGSTAICTSYSDTITAALTQGYPLSSLGNNIYSTNIPGIGIRLYREAENATNFSGYYPYTRNLTPGVQYFLASGYFVVEIVKTAAQTGSGALVPGLYSRYYVSGYMNRPF